MLEESQISKCCYTNIDEPLNSQHPGTIAPLPPYVLSQFCDLFPIYKKRKMFFGGHPVSITKQSCNQIFSLPENRVSPYLVCEKSDGVRYLLVVAKVTRTDLLRKTASESPLETQCYFISRGGHNSLQSFVVDIGVSFQMNFSSAQAVQSGSRHVVEILDGELVKQKHKGQEYFKFLIFDTMVHLGRNICQLPLRARLQFANKFLQCNDMLGTPPCRIPIELKDFFRLTNRKFNLIDFMLNKYIRMLQHQNDGLIFNHEEKEYLLGTTNPGYIKWKPQHLNTVDFMIVPNANLEDKFGRKVLDLYVAFQDNQLSRYSRQFYAFTVISEMDFDHINELLQRKEEERFKKHQQTQDFTTIDEFTGAIIAECRYDKAKGLDERSILSQLSKEPIEDLRAGLMKQGEEERDTASLRDLSKKIFDKNWHIYKIREDKSLPNNIDVVKRIEESIRDGIKAEDLLRRGKEINEKSFAQ